jgi:OOP family OmpA-OmpF porin
MSGVAVNTKGIAVDVNKNGIPDEIESSLDDRFVNESDYVTKQRGGGNVKELLDKGYVNVYFKFNSTTPETYSLEAINYLIKYMEANPSTNAELIGYADEIGNPTYNKNISEKRANKVKEILVASGVAESRLTVTGNGEDTSVEKSSAQARQLVRRVTFKLK